jgi:hypothetical protein
MNTSTQLFYTLILTSTIVFTSCNTSSKNQDIIKKEFNTQDYKKVKSTILDYVEGLYLVDSKRIDKSVDTKLRKIGYWFNPEKKGYIDNLEMTHSQLSNLAAKWNKNGKNANENSPK